MATPADPSAIEDVPGLTRRLEIEVHRVVDRMGHLTLERLQAPAPPWPSRAAAGREVAQALADAAAALEGISASQGSRQVPELAPTALADQLSVLGADLLSVVPGAGKESGPESASTEARQAVTEVLRSAVVAVVALRRAI